MSDCVLGFNGERLDPVSGTTHLGNGYRAYNPVLMRFNCPDSMSPFGAGGINPYAYCAGDPVNHADPTGHWSLGQWIGLAVGIVAGIALGIATAGAAMPAVLTLMALAAGGAAIGAGSELVTEAVDGQRVNWGQVGISAGIGAVAELVGYGVGKGLSTAYRAIKGSLSGATGRLAAGAGYAPEQVAQYDRIALRRVRTIMADPEQRAHRLLRRSSAATITESARIGPDGSAYVLGMGERSVADYALALESANDELFVVAHGAPGEVQIGGNFMDSTRFAEHLRNNVNSELNEYRSITLAICDSGSGTNSIGEAVSQLAGRDTIVRAFRGNIEATQTEFGDFINRLTSSNIRRDLTNMLIRRPSLFDFDFHYRREQLVTWPR